ECEHDAHAGQDTRATYPQGDVSQRGAPVEESDRDSARGSLDQRVAGVSRGLEDGSMPVRVYKPTSPGRRNMSVSTFDDITRSKPEKSLLRPKKSTAGRNNQGRITSRHRGGGHKQRYRLVDF